LTEQPRNPAEKTNQKTQNYNLDLSIQRGHAIATEQLRLLSAIRDQEDNERLQTLSLLINTRYGGRVSLRQLERSNGWKYAEVKRLAAKFPHQLLIEGTASGENGGRPGEIIKVIPPVF
jgi:hypothetical protein